MKFYFWFAAIFAVYQHTEASRILAVLPVALKSHYFPFRKIVLELSRRGHEVVCISPFKEVDASENLKWIQVETSSLRETVPELTEELKKTLTFFGQQFRLWKIMNLYAERIVNLPKLKHFIEHDNSTFDLVLAEDFFLPLFYTFAYKYKAPLVLASSFGLGHYMNEYMGNAIEVSHIAHEFSQMYGDLSVLERIENLIYTTFHIVARKLYSVNPQNELSNLAFNKLGPLPKVEDIERNTSLLLLNSHFSMTMSLPLLPNMIEIGGLHIDEPQPLPTDLKKILDGAENGVIVFSFGSILEPSQLPDDKIQIIFNALGSIPQRVLIKWDNNIKLSNSFNNIFTVSWLPQNDVLAHPKVKALVTHGGLLSAQEAVHHGVPTICIPFYGDQFLNCKRSVHLQYGLQLLFHEITEESLKLSLEEIVNNSKYKENARELSKRFRDRLRSPLDSAIFWIEYVIKQNGADFIKSPKRHLFWFQCLYLDILFYLLFILWAFKKVIKKIFANNKVDKIKIN